MKKFLNFLRKHAKKVALVAAVPMAVLGVSVVSSWGPDRPTFTIQNPASYITFNSITDNPHVGDEREFVSIKDAANTNDGGWRDSVTVEPGKEYLVRVYVHNNAADNLNLVATNTRVSAGIPTATGKSHQISGFVSADNAQPQRVWDDIRLSSSQDFNLAYVPGSARIYNNGYAAGGNGQPLPDSIVTSAGALIGYNAADGKVPGCFKYDNFVYFKVKPQFAPQPNFEVAKTVSEHDKFEWKENVSVEPGDSVDFRIRYKNTGETQQDNVVVKDKLPAGMSYVNGSTKLYNALNPNGKTLSDNVTKNTGVNIGSHAAGASSFVVFTAKVVENDKLAACGPNVLKNIARVETDNGSKEDDATVDVDKECEEMPPIYECRALTARALGDNQYRFNARVRAENGATVNKYIFNFGDNSEELHTDNRTVEHTYPGPGAYTATVRVVFNVNNAQEEVTGANCQVTITIPEEPCPYNPELPKDSPKCVQKPEKPEKPGKITELPSTGPAAVIAGIFGTSATAYGAYAFVESRRALKNIR